MSPDYILRCSFDLSLLQVKEDTSNDINLNFTSPYFQHSRRPKFYLTVEV